jgi:hypothetical protein
MSPDFHISYALPYVYLPNDSATFNISSRDRALLMMLYVMPFSAHTSAALVLFVDAWGSQTPF